MFRFNHKADVSLCYFNSRLRKLTCKCRILSTDTTLISSNDAATDEQHPYRWVMLVLIWLIYIAFGLLMRSISPLVTPIIADLNLSYSQMGLILGSASLAYIFVATIAGTIIDKWGVRRSLLLGTLVMASSALLRYFPHGFGTMFAAVALLGVGGPMISVGGPKVISLWFRGESRSTAISLYVTGPWIGMVLAFALTNNFVMPIADYNWRVVFVIYGLFTLLVACLWWLLAKDNSSPHAVAGKSSGVGVLVTLLKARSVQAILIMGLLCFAFGQGFMSWLPKILETKGLSAVTASLVSSVPIVAGIPAILLIPRLTKAGFRAQIVIILAIFAIAALWIVMYGSNSLFFSGLVLYGLANASILPLLLLLLMDSKEVGARHMGSAGGLYFCVAEIGGFTGPLVVGGLVDLTASFSAGILFLSGLYILMVITSSWLLSRKRHW